MRRLGLWGIVPVAMGLFAASPAYANTPAPFNQLQLGSPSATRTYGQPMVSGNCSATANSYQTTVSLSADANGDGVLTIGSPDSPPTANSVSEVSPSQLELLHSTSGTAGSETYTFTSRFDGYGTSFTGTFTQVYKDSGGSVVCTITIPQTLTLQGSGLTLGAATKGPVKLADACDTLESDMQKELQDLLNSAVQDIKANIEVPGPGDLNVAFDGGTGQGSSIRAPGPAGAAASSAPSGCSVGFEGTGGSGSSIRAPGPAGAAVPDRAALGKGTGKKTVLMAQLHRHFKKRGTYKIKLHINKAGHKLLAKLAAADRAYFNANPGGTSPPKDHFRIKLRFKR